MNEGKTDNVFYLQFLLFHLSLNITVGVSKHWGILRSRKGAAIVQNSLSEQEKPVWHKEENATPSETLFMFNSMPRFQSAFIQDFITP